jgi:hypothetical protein
VTLQPIGHEFSPVSLKFPLSINLLPEWVEDIRVLRVCTDYRHINLSEDRPSIFLCEFV